MIESFLGYLIIPLPFISMLIMFTKNWRTWLLASIAALLIVPLHMLLVWATDFPFGCALTGITFISATFFSGLKAAFLSKFNYKALVIVILIWISLNIFIGHIGAMCVGSADIVGLGDSPEPVCVGRLEQVITEDALPVLGIPPAPDRETSLRTIRALDEALSTRNHDLAMARIMWTRSVKAARADR